MVDALTEEEVDLKICCCFPWVKWIRFCNGWVCDLVLENFGIVGGFAIWGWKTLVLWLGLRFRVGKIFEVCDLR